MRQEYLIQGMTCASCARNIEASLRRMPEIENVEVNFVTNRATLIIKEGLGVLKKLSSPSAKQPAPSDMNSSK
ncbi:MAG: heavy-metal-associated domain-containing protein [Bdellovibrionales bacterium]|nr:heavy-metal-associated domain-containing protein [Bdellovibrionales bacterium]